MISQFVKKLMFTGQVTFDKGFLEFLGEREASIPTKILAGLQDINPKRTYAIAKRGGEEEMEKFAGRLNMDATEISVIINKLFELNGLGNIEILEFNIPDKRAVVRVYNNPIALYHAVNNKRIPCTLLEGLLAGMFSFIFESDVTARETACMQNNRDYCEYTISKE